MAALSSTSNRRGALVRGDELLISLGGLLGLFGRGGITFGRSVVAFEGKFQRERCAQAQAFALDRQRAPEFGGGNRAAVQAEAMAIGTRGEAVAKDAGDVFRGDADAVVNDLDLQAIGADGSGADRHNLVITV